MKPYFERDGITIYHGDCREVMAGLGADSFDAVVCDPPYGLEFMGKEWDSFKTGRAAKYARGGELTHTDFKNLGTLPQYVSRPAKRCAKCGKQAWSGSPCKCDEPAWELDNSPLHAAQAWHTEWARAALRVLKPGGHLVAFGGTRTFHRLTCALEDAGFEIRDCLAWMYGSGFPKSLDVSKAIDKAAGAEREVIGRRDTFTGMDKERNTFMASPRLMDVTAPATNAARQWQGWGTALKPAWEPIILARKPLSERNVAANVAKWGTGALNIDGCRIVGEKGVPASLSDAWNLGWRTGGDMERKSTQNGRWPANVALDEEAARLLDEQSGERPSMLSGGREDGRTEEPGGFFGRYAGGMGPAYGDSGGASRFFYCAKADGDERGSFNSHPTVKPVSLMAWLLRLVVPTGGSVLDPFLGSGTTAVAAREQGLRFTGIEREESYLAIAAKRLAQQVFPMEPAK